MYSNKSEMKHMCRPDTSDNADRPAMVGGLANDAHLNFLCPTRELPQKH